MPNAPETIPVDDALVALAKSAIEAALAYEATTGGNRKLGITAEIGRLLACHALGLRLVLDQRCEGYDALDPDGLRVEVKARRSESPGLPRDAGRTSSFSKHEFDYALLVLLDHDYELCEMWRAEYEDVWPIIEREGRRNPSLSSFKRVGRKVYPADGSAARAVTVVDDGTLTGGKPVGKKSKYEQWLDDADFHETKKGVRFGLRFYVYPDGHGNIQHIDSEGKVQQENQPVSDVDEAVRVLRDLWQRGMQAKTDGGR